MGLVLASSSPRRHELLARAGIEHRVVAVLVDESPLPGLSPAEFAGALAERKARAAAARVPGEIVLGADTLIVLEGEILGKPADRDDAARMLARLSGREHEVITAVCLLCGEEGAAVHRTVRSRVRFRELAPKEIEAYVAGGDPLDKAGAYGIQGEAGGFVEELIGSRDNVIGLPVAEVLELLGGQT